MEALSRCLDDDYMEEQFDKMAAGGNIVCTKDYSNLS